MQSIFAFPFDLFPSNAPKDVCLKGVFGGVSLYPLPTLKTGFPPFPPLTDNISVFPVKCYIANFLLAAHRRLAR